MVPASGSIIFDSQAAQSSIISPLSAAPRLSYDNAGGLNITSYTTATSALDRFSVDGSNGRLFSITDALTGIIFSVNDTAGLPVIQVDSNLTDIITIGTYGFNTLVVNDTKVGIGTATPNEKLAVIGAISSTNIVYASGGNSNLWNSTYNTVSSLSANWSNAYTTVNSISTNGSTTYTTVNTNSASWSSVYSTVCAASANYILDGGNTKGSNIVIGTNDNFNLNLETANTTQMTITSAGNIGIGTTTAAAKLQIIHDASTNPFDIRRTGFLGSQLFTISNLGDITGGAAVFTPKLGHAVPGLTVTGNGTNPTAIFQTGNVGIGTTTPNANLTVVGVISSTNIVYASGGNSDLWNSVYSNVNASSARRDSVYTTTNANSANWSSVYTTVCAASANYILDGGNTKGAAVTIGTNDVQDFNLETSGANRLTILAAGNVGIGTITPSAKLTVSGNISANGTLAVAATSQSDGIGVIGNNGTAGIGMRISNTAASGSEWWLFSSGSIPSAGIGGFGLYNNTTSKYALRSTSAGVVTFEQVTTLTGGMRIPTQSSYFGVGTYGTVSETNGGLAYITGNNIKASTTVNNQVEKVTSGANAAQFIRMRYDQGISLHTGVGAGDAAGTNYADDINSRLIVNLAGNVGIGTTTPSEKLTVAGTISSNNVIYASGGNSNLWNQNTSALYQATSGQFAVKNANNYFSASQSLTGNLTVKGIISVDKGDGTPLQEVSTKNFSIAMAIALS